MTSSHGLTPKRLAPLQQLAETREQEAAQKLADARKLLSEREAQLHALENYEEPASSGPASVAQLRNREAFRARLAEAIRMQKQVIVDAQYRVEQAREHWLNERRELKVVDQLMERSVKRERDRVERREVRELDELALRLCVSAHGLERGA